MALEISCPMCGETEALRGERTDSAVTVTCDGCGQVWDRPLRPTCSRCEGLDVIGVPHAIVEKSRGTQLSVVGIRIVHLCVDCDADDIQRWQNNRPNPLLPRELPTVEPNTE